jgi:uncharacterized protein related to proFAR isomerase
VRRGHRPVGEHHRRRLLGGGVRGVERLLLEDGVDVAGVGEQLADRPADQASGA